MTHQTPLFARQAIYDKDKKVVAYELLFRHSDENYADFIDGDQATTNVLLNTFGSHQLEDIVGPYKAFVNYTKNLLLSPPPLPTEKLVIEILEDIRADEALLNALEKLKNKGYELALDDFFMTKDTKKMMSYADIIKVDVLSLSKSRLEKYVRFLKPQNITLLAEKIEDQEMFDTCVELGFDCFQGYFLCKPEVVKGVKVSEGKETLVRLISVLNDEDVEFEDVIKAIASDSNLSYKIIKLVNSSAVGVKTNVESLSQAVSMLGLAAIRQWATYLLMVNNSDKPRELCVISMCRAKFCESLGLEIGGKNLAEPCFTAGILSNLDAFLDIPMQNLMEPLKVSEAIKQALLTREGQVGLILESVANYERGQWDKINWDFFREHKLPPNKINQLYGESLIWASEVVNSQVS